MENDWNKMSIKEVEFFLKNGVFERNLIATILRNVVIKERIEDKIRKIIKDLKYFPKKISVKIEDLKQHEVQTLPRIRITKIMMGADLISYNIIPDFLIKLEILDAKKRVFYLPGEIERNLSSQHYEQFLLYSFYVSIMLKRAELSTECIIDPPFFIIYLFDNTNIQKIVKNRFGGKLIDLKEIEYSIENSDLDLCKKFLKNKLELNELFKIISEQSKNDPLLLKSRKKFILSFIYNRLDERKKQIFLKKLIEDVAFMTEVEDWKREFFDILSPEDYKKIPIDALKYLTSEQLKGLTPEQLKGLTPEQLKGLTPEQLKGHLNSLEH
ncbi:MAG: hypothetical protein ACTSRP_06695 [Candidatus Helarchaeota archaeon]